MSQLMFLQAITKLSEKSLEETKSNPNGEDVHTVPSAKPKGFLRNLDLKEL